MKNKLFKKASEIAVIEDLAEFISIVTPRTIQPLQGERIKWAQDLRSQVMGHRLAKAESRILFRGQRDINWVPIPQIDRNQFEKYRSLRSLSRDDHEKELLNLFIKTSRPHLSIQPANTWEWLALAQHHGLATRLLDWSTNPLSALFFAVESPIPKRDSVVWVYSHSGEMSTKFDSPFDISRIVLFYPPHLSARITTQGGCFTVHPDSKMEWEGTLSWIKITSGSQKRIQQQLFGLGITRATLFPDLDGLAANANWVYSE